MKKKLFAVLGGVLLSASVLVLNAHANGVGSSKHGKPPSPGPEPLSCILLLGGGATLVALRRWKNKKNSSKEAEEGTKKL